jgi:hypothetical protein
VTAAYRPKVLVDFDGVIHRYSKGWADGTVYDPPVVSARTALRALVHDGYEPVIFSTRDAVQITAAFKAWGWDECASLTVTNVKLPAVAQIDDRAIRFWDWRQALAELAERYPVERNPQP